MTPKPRDPRVEIDRNIYKALSVEAEKQDTTPKDLVRKWILGQISPETYAYLGIKIPSPQNTITPLPQTLAQDKAQDLVDAATSKLKTPKAGALAKQKEDMEDKQKIQEQWNKGLRTPSEIRDALGGSIKGSRVSKLLQEMGLRNIRKQAPKNR